MKISVRNKVLFQVLEHANDGTDIEPKFRMFLADATGNLVSVIKLHRGAFSGYWQVYSKDPNYSKQPAGIRVQGRGFAQNMYLHGKLGFDKKYKKCVGPNTEEQLMYRYEKTEGGKVCCSGSTRVAVELRDRKGSPVLQRNQVAETLTVKVGQNMLEAISVTYAIDRTFKMLGSKTEQKNRPASAQAVGGAFGLVGAVVAQAVDAGTKKRQNGQIKVIDFKKQ